MQETGGVFGVEPSESNVSGADRAADRAGFDPRDRDRDPRGGVSPRAGCRARRLVLSRPRASSAPDGSAAGVGSGIDDSVELSLAESSGAAGVFRRRTALHAWHLETCRPDGRVLRLRHGHARGHAETVRRVRAEPRRARPRWGRRRPRAPPRWRRKRGRRPGKKDVLMSSAPSSRDAMDVNSRSCAFTWGRNLVAMLRLVRLLTYVCSFRAFVGSLGTPDSAPRQIHVCAAARATPRPSPRVVVSSRPLVVTRFVVVSASSSPAPRRRRRHPARRKGTTTFRPGCRGSSLTAVSTFFAAAPSRAAESLALSDSALVDRAARDPGRARDPPAGGDRPSVVLRARGERDGPARPTQPITALTSGIVFGAAKGTAVVLAANVTAATLAFFAARGARGARSPRRWSRRKPATTSLGRSKPVEGAAYQAGRGEAG